MNEKLTFTNIKKIGVVSDLHIPIKAKTIPKQILKDFKDADLIISAGDNVSLAPLRELEKLAPVIAVYGNMDPPEVASRLKANIIINVNQFKIGIVHGHGSTGSTPEHSRSQFSDVDCIIFGHSHQPMNEVVDGILMFNPGSPTDHQFTALNTYGTLHLDQKIKGEIHKVSEVEIK
ncbi:MAG: metallophosphatase family protein [Nanoarchaeota archaeon]|nr:metallophosphatase family protein [Nanoarchaeota archaeon]